MLPNPYILIAAGAAFLIAITGAFFEGKHYSDLDWGRRSAEESLMAFKKGQTTQLAADQVAIDLGAHQGQVQEKIVTVTNTITKRIPFYVSDASGCITVGLVRVLDGAALGVDPATLNLNPGESNDTCSGIGSAALAKSVTANYGRANQNAGQLTDLQSYAQGIKQALQGSPEGHTSP